MFEDSGFSASVENSANEGQLIDLHICEEGADSSNSHGDHFHVCIGCSHVPFLQVQMVALDDAEILTKPHPMSYLFFLTSLYIDGPFQPPKA